MDHVAIMRKSWGLTGKILTGEKTIESGWYKIRCRPWNMIKQGDAVYFKDSGCPVSIVAEVENVLQFADLTPETVRTMLHKYGKEDGIDPDKIPIYSEIFKDKKYCILIFLRNPQKIRPFGIDKGGFGSMSAWISVEDINRIKRSL